MTAGLFGYLAYDLKDRLEHLPRTSVDDLGLLHLWLAAPAAVLVQDRKKRSTRLHPTVRSGAHRPQPPDLGWADVIGQVIRVNRLDNAVAAVKVLATHGTRERAPYDFNLLVTARAYTPRLAGRDAQGLQLLTYPHPRQSPLADFKTLNYPFYLEAGRWARSRGADEALILNPDGTVSETSSANMLLIDGKRVLRPLSAHVLPGVMEQAACGLLAAWG